MTPEAYRMALHRAAARGDWHAVEGLVRRYAWMFLARTLLHGARTACRLVPWGAARRRMP